MCAAGMQIMRRHPDHARVQEGGCELLACFARFDHMQVLTRRLYAALLERPGNICCWNAKGVLYTGALI